MVVDCPTQPNPREVIPAVSIEKMMCFCRIRNQNDPKFDLRKSRSLHPQLLTSSHSVNTWIGWLHRCNWNSDHKTKPPSSCHMFERKHLTTGTGVQPTRPTSSCPHVELLMLHVVLHVVLVVVNGGWKCQICRPHGSKESVKKFGASAGHYMGDGILWWSAPLPLYVIESARFGRVRLLMKRECAKISCNIAAVNTLFLTSGFVTRAYPCLRCLKVRFSCFILPLLHLPNDSILVH